MATTKTSIKILRTTIPVVRLSQARILKCKVTNNKEAFRGVVEGIGLTKRLYPSKELALAAARAKAQRFTKDPAKAKKIKVSVISEAKRISTNLGFSF